MKELFGQRLREQRIKHGLTLEQLAEKSELSSNYIGMVERGLKEPGLATIVKLLNALNISADTLLCDLVRSGQGHSPGGAPGGCTVSAKGTCGMYAGMGHYASGCVCSRTDEVRFSCRSRFLPYASPQ